jgi:hypothetical protein
MGMSDSSDWCTINRGANHCNLGVIITLFRVRLRHYTCCVYNYTFYKDGDGFSLHTCQLVKTYCMADCVR